MAFDSLRAIAGGSPIGLRTGTRGILPVLVHDNKEGDGKMKGIIAYLLGIPIVVIILLYVTGIF